MQNCRHTLWCGWASKVCCTFPGKGGRIVAQGIYASCRQCNLVIESLRVRSRFHSLTITLPAMISVECHHLLQDNILYGLKVHKVMAQG